MKIVLFDIDGTLIRSGGAGRDALDVALEVTFGKIGSESVEVNGRTDRGIARNLFQHHRIEDSRADWDLLRHAYLRALPECLRNRGGIILPGIGRVLEELGARADVAIGLLTGNVREGARIKLSYFALEKHFPFGGFGDDHCDRDDVARAAWQAAQQHVGEGTELNSIWVIGDTPWDIRCAVHRRERRRGRDWELFFGRTNKAHAPDLLFEDLGDFQPLLDAMLA